MNNIEQTIEFFITQSINIIQFFIQQMERIQFFNTNLFQVLLVIVFFSILIPVLLTIPNNNTIGANTIRDMKISKKKNWVEEQFKEFE